jgi:hypothetical protein
LRYQNVDETQEREMLKQHGNVAAVPAREKITNGRTRIIRRKLTENSAAAS